jgi:hypothetical protein
MKQFPLIPVFILFLLLLHSESFSQDRIVLITGDTLKCTIGKVTKNFIYYSQNFNGISANGKVQKSSVREWTFSSTGKEQIQPVLSPEMHDFKFAEEPEKPEINENKVTVNRNDRLRTAFSGGMGYITGNTDAVRENLQQMGVSEEDSKNYYKNLKLGYFARASAYYRISTDYWLGMLYHGFYSTAEITTSIIMDDLNMYYGRLGERYFVNFAGASFFSSGRYGKNKKIGLNSSYSIGPAFYRDEAEMYNEQILIKGTSFAQDLTIGVEYFIRPNISIGFESSLFSAKIRKIEVTTVNSSQTVELDKENFENLSRLNFSLGLVFYW